MASDRSRNWVRKQGVAQTRTSFPELFFDLVFVFALIQLSHALASDFSSTAAIESLLLIFAIWWVWINTTWVTNLLDTDKDPVRLLLFGLMFGGILLAIAIPEAFGTQGLVFAAIYSAMQVGRSVFTLYAFRGVNQASFLTFLRITLWMLVSSIFWIAGALEVRTALWSLALLIEYASPAVRYYVPGMGKSARETLDVSGEHMAERCALFVIICLGETILTTGRNAAEHMAGDLTFAVFCSAFLSTGFMWWIYFHHGQEKAADKAEATSKPESVALNLFTYGHLPIVAGIILAAVGQDFSLSHASEESTLKNALAILGGPALFLVGNIWVKLAAAREMPVSHIVGLVLLVMVALLLPITVNYHIQMFATAVLFVVALWEYLALRRIAPSSA
ncbi:low temperature requirement protein A [Rhizobium sp. 007]|uniref:low temperature requirement protein A n=1 Tax=Rhizobium sp. 007 TaxID=2785056 RepID=UPI00188DFCEC|nr:low temperature requirement protein A [Rhizobium sp. 007]QPB18470.1 low temperature requirement protein A [Rhizobium sp. 007]